MNNDLMFSSKNQAWETPKDFFDKYDSIYHFETDVCAMPENAKCKRFFTPEMDGLKQEWTGVCWMNPPYGRQIGKWVRKAYESARDNLATVVCLLPARTDTRWFHDYILPHAEVQFIKGRIKFGGGKGKRTIPKYASHVLPWR